MTSVHHSSIGSSLGEITNKSPMAAAAASLLSTTEVFIERSNTFNSSRMNFEDDSATFGNIQKIQPATTTTAAVTTSTTVIVDSTTMDTESGIMLVSTSQNLLTPPASENTENVATTSTTPIFDENSSSSNSTSSSTKSRKRKRENEILEEELKRIGVNLNHISDNSTVKTEDGAVKKENTPTLRLRPRRTLKSNSNSCSPIFLSPTKRSPKKTGQSAQSALEGAKNLQAFLNADEETMSSVAPHFDEPEFVPEKLKLRVPMVRSFAKSIVREVDVSVFAELISPFELSTDNVYPNNYVSLRIVDRKPMCFVNLNVNEKPLQEIPLLEIKAIDLNDRFELQHSKGVFDPPLMNASKKPLTVYLFGTYAVRAAELAKKDDVISVVKFRTSKPLAGAEVAPSHNLRNRSSRLSISSKIQDDHSFEYGYNIVVESLTDMEMISSIKSEVKKEDIDETITVVEDKYDPSELVQLFDSAIDDNTESKWAPLVSFSEKWRAPDNPKELNQTLYIFQPCVPKFECASKTVKM